MMYSTAKSPQIIQSMATMALRVDSERSKTNGMTSSGMIARASPSITPEVLRSNLSSLSASPTT